MSDVLTVQTPFGDIADLAQGFIGRVTAQQIIVNVAQPVAPGEQVRFQVLLADGTLAFWGDGHCAQIQDHGDAVEAHERFELLLHTLSFPDERSQPVYEYMVSLSESATPSDELTASEEGGFAVEEASTGEVGTDELEALDAAMSVPPDEAAMSVPPDEIEAAAFEAPVEELEALAGDAPTEDAAAAFAAEAVESPAYEESAQYEDAAPYQAASQHPSAFTGDGDPAPTAISNHPGPPPGGVLTRLSSGNNWAPVRPEKAPPMPRSGLFAYAFGPLPVPSRPPRPDLDPSLRVRPAQRPAAQ